MENITAPREFAAPPALTASDPFALIDAHIEAIKPAHQEAWRGPVVRDYAIGSLVWMWDHYNTAIVEHDDEMLCPVTKFSPGDRIRITAEWRARLAAGGVSAGYVERISRGVVVDVEVTEHWTVVSVETANGQRHGYDPDDIELDGTR